MWGIFLAYIRRDSRRDSVFTYFGKRGVTRNTYKFPRELLGSRVSHLFPKEQ